MYISSITVLSIEKETVTEVTESEQQTIKQQQNQETQDNSPILLKYSLK